MQTSKEGMIAILAREGVCLSKYKDSVGVWTIGPGYTATEIPDLASWPMNKTLTLEECLAVFPQRLKKYENALNNALKVPILQHQFDALVSIAYNIGGAGAANSTFMKRINAGLSNDVICAAIMMWNKPPEITRRRQTEAKQYKTGDYGDTKINVFPVSPNGRPLYAKGKIIDGRDYL